MRRYFVGGVDLSSFSYSWLDSLECDDAPATGLLEFVDDGYLFGVSFMTANIAPRACDPEATDKELLLFAVLFVFHVDRHEVWQGPRAHLDRAFEYAMCLGDSGMAEIILQDLARESIKKPDPFIQKLISKSLVNSPARLADHDREIANIQDRQVRAANLLDPTKSIDEFLF